MGKEGVSFGVVLGVRGCIPSAYYESLCLGWYWMPGLKYDILGLKLYIVFTACLSRKIIGLYGHKSGKIPLFGFERLKFLILREWTSCSLSFFFVLLSFQISMFMKFLVLLVSMLHT